MLGVAVPGTVAPQASGRWHPPELDAAVGSSVPLWDTPVSGMLGGGNWEQTDSGLGAR